MFWRDEYPKNSPTHQQTPFAFKAHAFREALSAGYTTILWLDASVWAVSNIARVVARIQTDGHLFVYNGWKLGQWCSDYSLARFGVDRDWAMDQPDLTAMLMGVDVTHRKSSEWLNEFIAHCQDEKLMHGSLHNDPGREIVDPHSKRNVGVISGDPRCRGHSREQAIAGLLAAKHGFTDFALPPDPLQFAPPSHEPHQRSAFQACGL
jgi:hypothetical protein